jgi:polar amino acid transport system permease protein
MNYDWNFSRITPYTHAFLSGAVVTLVLTAIVIVLGTVFGIFFALSTRKSKIKFLLYPLIDVLRALPPLVLILFMYYFLTRQVVGVTVPAFWVCTLAMSLNLAAFVAELVRSAIENVPLEALDAGRALGMTSRQITRHIVMPRVIREVIPGMTVLYIGILKMSSLASVINVREVVYTAQTVIADSSRSLEAWTVVALIYLVLVIPATYAARALERWSGRGALGESRKLKQP